MLHEGSESKESFLFVVEEDEQGGHHVVHALNIPNFFVVDRESSQNIDQCKLNFLGVELFRKRSSIDVVFDLTGVDGHSISER